MELCLRRIRMGMDLEASGMREIDMRTEFDNLNFAGIFLVRCAAFPQYKLLPL